MEVHINLCVKKRVEPISRDRWIDAGLAAVAKDLHGPAVRAEALGAVVLRAAHNVTGRLRVNGKTLELECPEPRVHRRDRRRDPR